MENSKTNYKENEKVLVNGMNFEIRPNWKDNDISEIYKYKLPPEKQLEKRIQRVSKNYHKASSEYRNYLESLRSDERVFWSLCRSVSPVRSKSKEKSKSRTVYKGKSTDDSNIHTKSSKGSDNTKYQTNHEAGSGINFRGRSKRIYSSETRNACSLPPNLEQKQKITSNGNLETTQDRENNGEIDLYLTYVRLQSCIEKYSRQLYNLCKMMDLDSEDEFYEDAYFEEISYGIPDRVIKNTQVEDKKGHTEISASFVKTEENTLENKSNTQPQISNETINETASKWSTRLRANQNSSCSPGFDANNNPISPSMKLSKATRSRLSLKEKISNMNLSEINIKKQIHISNNYKDKNIDPILNAEDQPIANVIITQNAHISKQPFSSLFNM
ncbi:uncharacterized protein cubi_00398 [Cryptosporidium ubiquitum]|uniref:Uncharacterized protein n=1 Tax=Cryptosporidium ubiquitum TaxID=857276 RepID=A0A1J4MG20_9CRYT|nr:uncharacterized protein cubi_00398 [Cryptosporidium ubiquitum]OII72403.1 hypothetical protein cubi_00398 [Cryptosporidium ubiquitum]